MSFTDDDLKRVKQYLDEKNWEYQPSHDVLKALLARLEAAEKVVEDKINRGWGNHPLVEIWRKAAGK
jgi:hypothetical protein